MNPLEILIKKRLLQNISKTHYLPNKNHSIYAGFDPTAPSLHGMIIYTNDL